MEGKLQNESDLYAYKNYPSLAFFYWNLGDLGKVYLCLLGELLREWTEPDNFCMADLLITTFLLLIACQYYIQLWILKWKQHLL